MTIWMQSLSCTLIWSLGQGLMVWMLLRLLLWIMPALTASARYNLALSALTALLAWFGITWWQQYQALQSIAPLSAQPLPSAAAVVRQEVFVLYRSGSAWLFSLARVLPWLSVAYLLGVAFMLLRLSAGVLQLFSWKSSGTQPLRMEALLSQLKDSMQVKGPVRLFTSAKARVPMVIGYIKPVILVPAAALAQLSPAQLELVLLHELAHIRRNDYLINVLQVIAETILFFNPFAWMISALVRREREHCCDDLVLSRIQEPLSYARTLAVLAEYPGNASALAVAASGQSHQLFHRIKRIMEMKKNPFSYSRVVAAVLITGTIACAAAWLSPSYAGPGNKKPETVRPIVPSNLSPVATLVAADGDATLLVNQLADEHLVDVNAGFTVEKRGTEFYIDGVLQPAEIAGKYLSRIREDKFYLRVGSLEEWLRYNPDMVTSPWLHQSRNNTIGRPGC